MMALMFSSFFMIPLCSYLNWYFYIFYFCLIFLTLINSFHFVYFFGNMSYGFGGDMISVSLILLSVWIIMLMFLSSYSIYKNQVFVSEFVSVNLFLFIFLLMSFSTENLFNFYLFFECSLIPTLFLILGWGYQPERLSAGYYMLFYTLFFSLPMLLGIFYVFNKMHVLSFFLLNLDINLYLYMCMIMAFLVKMPMIFMHFWLPKAHVEAPISGSMILAGVLLKLGGYGILRVYNFLGPFKYDFVLLGLSLYGMFLVGLLCLFQIDMKSLIAYSSVSHMGMVICGIFTFNYWGMCGSLIMMVAHGLCSSGMFCLANIAYERSGSRLLFSNKGLITFMPSMSMFWFLICVNNSASPPSLNLMGEILLINGVMSWSCLSLFFLMFSSFITCVYSIYLYSYLNHGNMYSGYGPSYGIFYIEYLLMFMHWFPLNFLFLSLDNFSVFL